MKNNFKHQELLSKETFLTAFNYISQFDSEIGIFSSFLVKNNSFYLFTYLNLLIHGLATAAKKYTIYKTYYSMYTVNDFDDLSSYCSKEFDSYKLLEENRDVSPQLISFKIGDLLRCKCSSKEF